MGIAFNPGDPYPLVADYSYEEAKNHASQADQWLGFRISTIESKLQAPPGQQAWIGLSQESLQTPYIEIRSILALLAPQTEDTVVDLGAAYGRVGLVMARHYPENKFIGYELLAERVEEGNRVLREQGCLGAKLNILDLSVNSPEAASFYFIYDYGTRSAIAKTINDLQGIAAKRKITVVGRGRAVRDCIEREQPWLSMVHAPQHEKNFSIYYS